jgi:iron complex outermembrane receptor protein
VDGTGEHSLVSGAEIEGQRRTETRTTLQDGVPLLTEFGDNLKASSTRLAVYAQDEWAPSPNWATHVGLRWEGILTVGDAGDGTTPENRSSVWTPLLHAVWKPDPKGRNQVRVSLTRSYRSPALGSLIARPAISPQYPVGGPNTPTRPDRAGNPELEPELAAGLDLALEHYLDQGGVLSANLFYRRIKNQIRSVTALEDVSWSPVPRWVARPQNISDATTVGLETEAKFRLDQAFDGAPPVELRANLSVYRSSVDDVPGPDNRLDEQPGASANLGVDYRFRGLPLSVGGNLNWVPGYRTQLDATRATTVSTKHVFDAYALWTFSPTLALRVLASNLAPPDFLGTNTVDSGRARETASTLAPSYTNWLVRLELKL